MRTTTAKSIKKTATAAAVAALLGAASAPPAWSAACTLTTNGNWGTASNWSCGVRPGTPNPADTATLNAGGVVTVTQAEQITSLTNAGTVNIDAFLLTLLGGGSTSNAGGVINVGGASTGALQVSAGHNVNNTGGNINVGNGSVLNQFGSSISGGTITTTGTGQVVVFSNSANIFSGVTLNGTMDASSNANSRQRIGNGLTLNGAVNIGNNGIVSLDSTLGATNTLGGTGTINLNDASARLAIEGTGTTTLGANIVVRGQGNVGAALLAGGTNILVVNGRVSADVSGGTLALTLPASGAGSSITNNGLLDARGGGILQLSTPISNAGGVIDAQNGSTVTQNGVRISGGTISSSGSGTFTALSNGANILDAVTLNGTMDMASVANSRQRIVNGATLNGVVNIANGGVLSLDSNSTAGGAQTILGSGVVNLNAPGAWLAVEGSGATTLGAGLTVRGQGIVGQALFASGSNTLTNLGLVSADVGGGTLNIVAPANGASSSFVNGGTLQAIGGGSLLLSTNITANPGSQIVAGAGSSVVQNGVRINGVVTATGTGNFVASSNGGNILDGVSFSGTLDMTSAVNSRERIANGATLNGSVNIANGGILSLDSSITPGGSQSIGGTGVINLNDAGARLAIEGSGSTTLGAGITVRGQGNIGQALLASGTNVLTGNGLISADVSGGALNIVAPANGSGSSFVNGGTLQAINGGTLYLSTNITANPGSQIVAGAGSAVVQNGVRINGVINASGSGVFTASSNSNNVLDGATFSGNLDVTSITNGRERIANGATINGGINIGNGGVVSLDSSLTAGGAQTINGNAVFNLNDAGARLAVEGSGATTLGSNVVVRGQGNFGQALFASGNNAVTNNGRVSADVAGGTLTLTVPANSAGSSFNNSNLLDARNGGTLQLATNINNAGGQIAALNGSTVVQSGSTITGGVISSTGSGVFAPVSSTGNILAGVTITGVVDMTSTANSRERIANGALVNGAINIANGGILSLDAAITSGGSQTLSGGGTINLNDAGARLAMEGNGSTTLGSGLTVRGQGNIGTAVLVAGNHALINNGLILADGGTLNLAAPASGGGSALSGSGTLQVNGGSLNLNTGNASTQGQLVMGGAGSALNLSTHNLTITSDYTNAAAGFGNSFDRRANISGTGLVLAGGDAAQAITGANVTGGTTTNATLTISNARVGATTYNYQIANTGTTGPSLRGAIQTTANGASLTDPRLSGAGVAPSNYNTGGPGSNTGDLAVTFTVGSAGVIAPLVGQKLNLTSNFSNIPDQKLNIVVAPGAAAYNAAAGSATPSPTVTVANQRTGGSNSTTLTVANTAAAGAFSEDLNASFGTSTGAATGSGSISGRLAGTNSTGSGAMSVAVNTGSAGAKTGTVTLNYQTAGAVNGVSNGLGTASVGSQVLTVNGNVYQAASGALQTAPLNFGTLQVGQTISQNLVVRNTASGAAGFVEDLNVTFGSTTGVGSSQISGSGSLNGILAGTNSTVANGTMTVSVTGATVGPLNGSIGLNYFSAGKVNGVSNGLGSLAVGGEAYGVLGSITPAGTVINQALPVINNPVIDLGAVRVGAASPSATVSVTNQATVAPQAALNATISGGAPLSTSGSFNLLLPGNSSPGQAGIGTLQVALNTGTAGNFTGVNAAQATLGFVSDASNVGGCEPTCTLSLGSQTVSVSGKVYTPAVGALATPVVDFGVVRVGDTVSARNITINNTAAVTALNDSLRGNLSGVSGPFTGAGTVGGVAAGGSGNLAVGLNTSTAGVFNQAGSVAFLSQNSDMSDVSAGPSAGVTVKAQVNNLANAKFDFLAGLGLLTQSGDDFVLDLGNVFVGTNVSSTLGLENFVGGPADELSGGFDLTAADDFGYAGWNPVSGLGAGQGVGGLNIHFLAGATGFFSDSIVFNGLSTNASDPVGIGETRRLQIRANVIGLPTGTVPEPGSLALLLTAALAALVARRRASH